MTIDRAKDKKTQRASRHNIEPETLLDELGEAHADIKTKVEHLIQKHDFLGKHHRTYPHGQTTKILNKKHNDFKSTNSN